MKGLEVLKEIREQLVNITDFATAHNDTLRVKYCLNTKEDFERYVDNIIGIKTIEKEIKALEIIKEKNVDVLRIKITTNVERYNERKIKGCRNLTQKEYDLLKEVLL